MKKSVLFAWLLGVSPLVLGEELSLDWDWAVSAEAVNHRDTLYIQPTKQSCAESINGLLDVEAGYGSWRGLFALKGNNLYSSDETVDSDTEFVIRELFWQDVIDVADTSLDVTLGKIRLDWGIGYGYRPLDIFKPYRRNPVGIQIEEGTGVASLAYFDMQGEWTLLYTDSSWTDQSGNELEEGSEQQGVGVRRYGLVGDHEYQWLAYYDDVRRGLIGGSFVSVLNEAWEIHASAIYQSRYLGYQIGSDYAPVELEEISDAFQSLIGVTWANETGNSVIVEYWYDSRAWRDSEWRKANRRVEDLSANSGFDSLRYSYARGFNHANLVQHNLMFHWSLDASAWVNWQWSRNLIWLQKVTPTFDLLYSPADKGVIATQWLSYLMLDTGEAKAEMEVAARFLGGSDGSVYTNLPDDFMLLLNIKGKF